MHGTFGEDGVIQSILSKNNIPFNGSGEKSSRNCFDKSVTKEIVMNQGVLSPKYYQTSSNTCNDHLDFKSEKYVVKPNSQGSSVGFNVIDNFENLNDAIDKALDFDNSVLIEEFIDGKEITVPILGNEPLPVIEIEPKSGIYDYSRVDFKFYENNFYFLEINTLPGMTETSLFPMAAKRHGFSFKDIINNIIKLSLQK